MEKLSFSALALAIALIAFAAGSWVTWTAAGKRPVASARKVLYWIDPMHPSYKSDKPGIAPDCGMQLEPVYADSAAEPVVAGGLKVPDEKRQLIGVRTGVVERRSLERTIRTVGRVTVDENRLYRLFAPGEGVVKQVSDAATGSMVRKDDLLLSIFRGDYDFQGRARLLGATQLFLSELDALERLKKINATPEQLATAKTNLQNVTDSLVNLGMSDYQIANLTKTRKSTNEVEVRSPVAGYLAARNVSARQPVDRGYELYRIADIGRVWILVDVFENESRQLRPGTRVRITQPFGRSEAFEARISQALPQFDPDSRTIKMRLDADNPGYALRPGMFVDAEIPVSLPPALVVPTDAVVDSGLRKMVYVDRGNGYFEPRAVETGWRFDDRIEIVKGLQDGDRIVLSGTFLLDSESRMKAAAVGISTAVRDPVCGMDVDEAKARAAGKTAVHAGRTYFFCSDDCKRKFEAAPGQYAAK